MKPPTPETKPIILILLLSIGVNLFFIYTNFSGQVKDFIPSISVNIISSIITFIIIVLFYRYVRKVKTQKNINEIEVLKKEISEIEKVDKDELERHERLIIELKEIQSILDKNEKYMLNLDPLMKSYFEDEKRFRKTYSYIKDRGDK